MFIDKDQVVLEEELLGYTVDEDDPHVKAMRLFKDNVKLATYCVKKFSPSYDGVIDLDDLHQIAYMALWEVCITYKDDKGAKFSTYAVPYIYGRILQELRRSNSLHLPRSYVDVRSALLKYEMTLPLSNEDVEFLLKNTRCSRKAIADYAEVSVTSLDAPVDLGDSSGSIYDILADDPTVKFQELSEEDLTKAIDRTLGLLNPSYRDMVEEWIYATIAGHHLTQVVLAKKYTCSQATANRVINLAIRVFRLNKAIILKEFGNA